MPSYAKSDLGSSASLPYLRSRWRETRGPALLLLTLCVAVSGCTTLFPGRSEEAEKEARLRELMTVPEAPDLIRQAAIPHGMRPVQVDGVALVLGLRGNGGPADPSTFRDQLLEELKRDDIPDPNHLLEQSDTALVRLRAVVPPGAQRRDRLDLRLLSPAQSEASDLHGGKLWKTPTAPSTADQEHSSPERCDGHWPGAHPYPRRLRAGQR